MTQPAEGQSVAAPTGARHDVGVDEMFFSTTDAKGVIEQANSVFVRMSRHPRQELVGAPHNIIRHPAMPGGAFKLMWDTLAAGLPFCAYVDNLAADGSTYGVFATITPLGDGYLSVRSRPFQGALHDAAFSLYAQVRPEELRLREEGATAHDAAVAGASRLGELLAAAGFPSYEEFVWTALPAEVESRLASSAGIPERPEATGQLAGMLDAARGIDVELRRWASGLDDLQSVASRLLLAAPQLRETMQRNQETAELIRDGEVGERFASAGVYLRVWADMAPEVGALVGNLLDQLGELRRSCAETRFRIALAVLHNTTVGQFVVELVDELPGADEARPAIGDLCQALEEGIVLTRRRADLNVALAASAADQIASIRDLLELPQTMIRQWLTKADRTAASFAEVADAVSAQVERTQADIDLLTELAGECRRIAVPLDVTEVDALLAVLADLAEPEAPGKGRRYLSSTDGSS